MYTNSSKVNEQAVSSANVVVQPALSISAVNDPFEKEADNVADTVMRMPANGLIQRKCTGCKEEEGKVQRKPLASFIQKKGSQGGMVASNSVSNRIASSRGNGSGLSGSTKSFMEGRFGTDFSKVNVHTGGEAVQMNREINAKAFTVGNDIYFNKGQYNPGSNEGKHLLAHELTHTVQQGGTNDVSGKSIPQSVISRQASNGEIIQRTPTVPSYDGVTGIRDMSKIRIDAIADFLTSDLTAPRDINAYISDPRVKHMTWMFYDPNDKMMPGSFSTVTTRPNPTSAPFKLKPSHFSGTGFVAGKYILRCSGLNAQHQPVVYADRDFNVLSADLTTGTAKTTTYGDLTFTKYGKTDANPPSVPKWSLDVELKFLPKASVSCTDIAFIQTAQFLGSTGKSLLNHVSTDIDARKTSIAWSIDQTPGILTPYYATGLDPTTGATVDAPSFGSIGKGGASPSEASVIDKPAWNKESITHFESCAICRSGTNLGQVYGCSTWGFTSTPAGKVTLMPRSFRQMHSDQFEEARAAWNTWRMTKAAAARPAAAPTLKSP